MHNPNATAMEGDGAARSAPCAIACLGCGYSLAGLDGQACPECARPHHPDDASVRSGRGSWDARRGVRRLVLASVVGGVGAGVLLWLVGAYGQSGPHVWVALGLALANVAGAMAGGVCVSLAAARIERSATWRLWCEASWLLAVPWASVAVAGGALGAIAVAFGSGAGRAAGFFTVFSLVAPPGFVAWGIVCWVALAMWLRRMIRGLRDGKLGVGRGVVDVMVLTLCGVFGWGAAAVAGALLGGTLMELLEATL